MEGNDKKGQGRRGHYQTGPTQAGVGEAQLDEDVVADQRPGALSAPPAATSWQQAPAEEENAASVLSLKIFIYVKLLSFNTKIDQPLSRQGTILTWKLSHKVELRPPHSTSV